MCKVFLGHLWVAGNYSINIIMPELNIKTKNWKELLTDKAFTREDLITIQKYETASTYSIVDAAFASVHGRSDAAAKAASSEKTAARIVAQTQLIFLCLEATRFEFGHIMGEETGEQECGSGEVVEKPPETIQEEFYRVALEEHERREYQGRKEAARDEIMEVVVAQMEEMRGVFIDANRFRQSVLSDILSVTSVFLEGLAQFLVGFLDHELLGEFNRCKKIWVSDFWYGMNE
ncbi:hypothetical protein HYC85_010421 [Camellia sinensis]|uniref:Uncharacterized protein n=1 Tax=Camellia sinensis TaxID=4442 RepID=A0A7J7HJ87_CAMSI|nr:hypothetical protein HYC85_010421 [Camellia sinensis]